MSPAVYVVKKCSEGDGFELRSGHLQFRCCHMLKQGKLKVMADGHWECQSKMPFRCPRTNDLDSRRSERLLQSSVSKP